MTADNEDGGTDFSPADGPLRFPSKKSGLRSHAKKRVAVVAASAAAAARET